MRCCPGRRVPGDVVCAGHVCAGDVCATLRSREEPHPPGEGSPWLPRQPGPVMQKAGAILGDNLTLGDVVCRRLSFLTSPLTWFGGIFPRLWERRSRTLSGADVKAYFPARV